MRGAFCKMLDGTVEDVARNVLHDSEGENVTASKILKLKDAFKTLKCEKAGETDTVWVVY